MKKPRDLYTYRVHFPPRNRKSLSAKGPKSLGVLAATALSVALLGCIGWALGSRNISSGSISFATFRHSVARHEVASVTTTDSTGVINGLLKNGTAFSTTAPHSQNSGLIEEITDSGARVSVATDSNNAFASPLSYLVYGAGVVIGLIFAFMGLRQKRRTQSAPSRRAHQEILTLA
jgi:ATP-dependent Zn protease